MHGRRVAFVGNHGLTRTLLSVAEELSDHNIETFWIMSGSEKWLKYLADSGVHKSRVLDVTANEYVLDEDALAEMESFSELSASAIIMSDRLLSKKDPQYAYAYLSNVYKSVKDFISSNSIGYVFGEAAWAHEVITSAAAKSCGAKFFSPCNLRYPSNRFTFFEGIFQKKIPSLSNTFDINAGRKLLNDFMNEPSVPFYMENRGKGKLDKALSFCKHLIRTINGDNRDETIPPLLSLIKDNLGRREYTRGTPEGRYVYLPLHCQPESSIDIQGIYNNNQTAFIEGVAKTLPYGVCLAVKKHPLSKVNISAEKLPNVVFVDGDSRELIKNSEMVISVAGTASYEAGLLGKNSVVFSDMFFDEL
jgi:hypothetical protein